jgi:hypothetical protein
MSNELGNTRALETLSNPSKRPEPIVISRKVLNAINVYGKVLFSKIILGLKYVRV